MQNINKSGTEKNNINSVKPEIEELNREQSKVHDHDNRKETTPGMNEPGEANPQIGEDTPTRRRIDPTREDERDNDHTRIKPGINDPGRKDPTRIEEP